MSHRGASEWQVALRLTGNRSGAATDRVNAGKSGRRLAARETTPLPVAKRISAIKTECRNAEERAQPHAEGALAKRARMVRGLYDDHFLGGEIEGREKDHHTAHIYSVSSTLGFARVGADDARDA